MPGDLGASSGPQVTLCTMEQPASQSIGSTSTGLLKQVQSNNSEAWQRLIQLYGPLVNAWLRRSGLQKADLDDCHQEVFRAVVANIDRFERSRMGSFRSWLRTIAGNKVIDHHRRAIRHPAGDGGSDARQFVEQLPDPFAADELEEAQEVQSLRMRALEIVRVEFEERTWQMFWLVAVEDQTPADVAEKMNVSPAAVRMAKSRVLARLRAELADLDPNLLEDS